MYHVLNDRDHLWDCSMGFVDRPGDCRETFFLGTCSNSRSGTEGFSTDGLFGPTGGLKYILPVV